MSEEALVLSLQQPGTPGTPEPMSSSGKRMPGISQTMNTMSQNVGDKVLGFQPPLISTHCRQSATTSIKSRKGINLPSFFKFKKPAESNASVPYHQQVTELMKDTSTASVTKALSWFTNKEEQPGSKHGTGWFGKAPWHRKDSDETVSSVPSSVREVLAGKTPPATPDPDSFYYRQIDYTTTPYPAGEATRVKTPPTHEETADGKPRGFFTEMLPPRRNEDTWSPLQTYKSASAKRLQGKCGDTLPKKPKEWWDAKQRTQSRKLTSLPKFEFDVPEHLPNSPMCPANPKHTSGGKGLCIYHGRRKTGSTLKVEHER
ncbi:hypothetical protein CGRA01v4_02852 [Colletotrichum graminicola]|nr:hypothetical protein CGRA01v4_02852 [Colletotrichum graminicola]